MYGALTDLGQGYMNKLGVPANATAISPQSNVVYKPPHHIIMPSLTREE